MCILVLSSAFFSSSEAALFYLGSKDRLAMSKGSRAQRMAIALLADPDRLLTAVLFWNLLVNLVYFTISSIICIRLEAKGQATTAATFAFGTLLTLIVFSEMLPKCLSVLKPRVGAAFLAVPLTPLVRIIDPVLPVLRSANTISRRLLFPRFQPEPHLRVGDLERAVQFSTSDAALLEQEQNVLQNIVSLSEIRADELMRPRTQFMSFRPPVSLSDLSGKMPPSGYLLVTEPDSDEVASAIDLHSLSSIPAEHLEYHAEPVVYVPWSTNVAEAFESMRDRDRQVAVIVNEHGETIGVLTFEDILDTIFSNAPSRSKRLLKRVPIRPHAPGVWQVTGMTSLRRLAKHFEVDLPPGKSVTVAGVVQEILERFPEVGDTCRWGPFRFEVVAVPRRGPIVALLTLEQDEEDAT
jgi:CBS domain containing-hemolysin-like protein